MTAAAAQALRSLAPPPRPELLSLDLPRYDPAGSGRVDLAMVGGGPAGLAVAQRVAEAGLSVCSIDPSPDLVWPNNYGVWVDEFDAMGLSDCLDTVWPSASVFFNDGDAAAAKSLDRPYARRKLKSTMMERCVAHGVRFHQAKVVKAVHDEASSLLVCDDGRQTGGGREAAAEGIFLLRHGCPAQAGPRRYTPVLQCLLRPRAAQLARLPVVEIVPVGAHDVWALAVWARVEPDEAGDHGEGHCASCQDGRQLDTGQR